MLASRGGGQSLPLRGSNTNMMGGRPYEQSQFHDPHHAYEQYQRMGRQPPPGYDPTGRYQHPTNQQQRPPATSNQVSDISRYLSRIYDFQIL